MGRKKIINWKTISIVLAVCIGDLVLVGMSASSVALKSGDVRPLVQLAMDFVGMILMCVILISCAFDMEEVFNYNRYFIVLCSIEGLTLFFDALSWIVDGYKSLRLWNLVSNYLVFIFGVLMSYVFFLYIVDIQREKDKYNRIFETILTVVIVADILFVTASLWTGWAFYINDDGFYTRGPYYIGSVTYLGITLVLSWISVIRSKLPKRVKATLYLYCLLPLIEMANIPYSISYVAIYICLVLLYTNIYSQRGMEIYRQKNVINEQETQLMISQIQPHFIYNTLNTIYSLCDTDVEVAKDTILNFSKYLRMVLDMDDELIPFEREMDHTKTYADIEKQRFSNITFKYEIEDTDFEIPSLTVQPLVENSIRHGLRGIEGAELTVKTYYESGVHVVKVIDNGIGLEAAKAHTETKKKHIGLSNVKSRVELMCGGTFEIVSPPEGGTVATVMIPDEREDAPRDEGLNRKLW